MTLGNTSIEPKIVNFLNKYNLTFVNKGKNVKRGNYAICCPFCGDDTGFHLGINPKTGAWNCWRSSSHRGKNFISFISRFLNCTYKEASYALGIEESSSGYLEVIESLFQSEKKDIILKGGTDTLELYPEFRKIESSGLTRRFWDYLVYRDFEEASLNKLIRRYNLLCSLTGDFRYRIIFPVYLNNKLITWTGRSIFKDAELRYRDLEVAKSVLHTKYTIYNHDHLKGGEILFITEGVIDAIKLDYYSPKGYDATCLFTLTIRDDQTYMLYELSKLYKKLLVVLEKGSENAGKDLVDNLSYIHNIGFVELDSGKKDAGELKKEEVIEYVRNITY